MLRYTYIARLVYTDKEKLSRYTMEALGNALEESIELN